MTPTFTRPAEGEYASFYAGYVARVGEGGLIEQMEAQVEEVSQLLRGLSEEAAMARYEPGKWSVKEVAGHRVEHVEKTLPVVLAAQIAGRMPAQRGERIAFFSQPVFAAIPASDTIAMSWYSPTFRRSVMKATNPEALARTLLDWNVRYVLTDNWFHENEVRLLVEAATSIRASAPIRGKPLRPSGLRPRPDRRA